VSCFTFRPNTERPVTITHGTNVLLGDDAEEIAEVRPSPHPPTPCAIPLWDGHAADRVAEVLVANYALMPAVAQA
jgi:UDP-N-acetylglucosamine 2-epimerase (non-hydrolysing)